MKWNKVMIIKLKSFFFSSFLTTIQCFLSTCIQINYHFFSYWCENLSFATCLITARKKKEGQQIDLWFIEYKIYVNWNLFPFLFWIIRIRIHFSLEIKNVLTWKLCSRKHNSFFFNIFFGIYPESLICSAYLT